MTKYAYENLSSEQFERLVVCLCQEFLGLSTQGFTSGRDGGRDAKFTGTTNGFPSFTDPWCGTVIIQAKHVQSASKSCSEKDFYGNTESVIASEIPRIRKLKSSEELDHYLLFTNRRLSADTQMRLKTVICDECCISSESVHLAGVDDLEILLKRFPNAAIYADIDPIDSPLIVSPSDLADVVERFDQQFSGVDSSVFCAPVERTGYAMKNHLNNMSEPFAKELKSKYLYQTRQIDEFLMAPENRDISEKYQNTICEFQLNIIAKRKDYQSFDEVMIYLHRLLTERDPVLKSKSKLTRLMLFYMYWNCDIGESDDAQTN
ncbi:ABC-three component system protein [Hydromonas duriensis]|uniref:ABC-three component systems C-terminal domain-containing protein n=1 Tax=Hydromonas duriensis TaxID=1527608 RepID=A0A4R6Y6B2_9BURK|nr:ABC-three component system protein [Hydromonas duriensis]TDR30347.1 hypothetical protein DFR44_12216 [Hydromonas duriensis]